MGILNGLLRTAQASQTAGRRGVGTRAPLGRTRTRARPTTTRGMTGGGILSRLLSSRAR